MSRGRFNTDAAALRRRIESHERFGSADLNAWIFSHLDPSEGQEILDLGAGTGKQSLALAAMRGSITSVDLSAEALGELRARAYETGVADRIETVRVGLDNLDEVLGSRRFDRVVSSYSLYYAREPAVVLDVIRHMLKPGGRMFVCGPSKQNNAELVAFHRSLTGGQGGQVSQASTIMEEWLPGWLEEIFGLTERSTFENPLRFDSAAALHTYWSSYNLFEPRLDEAFRMAAAAYFGQETEFVTVKRVLGYTAERPLPSEA